MAKNRFINTRFWNDGFIAALQPLDRYLFLYFLTNQYTNIAGIYELPLRTVIHETGLTEEHVRRGIERFKEKIQYIDGWVYILNFQRHQNQRSHLVQKGIAAEMEAVPAHVLEKVKGLQAISYLNSDSNSDSDSTSTIELRSKAKSTNPDIRPSGEFWVRACKAVQGIEPVMDWAKCNALLKKRLGHEGMTRDRLEMLMVWFLSQKKRYKDAKGNWQDKYKNTPDLAVMLSSARFNELLSDEQNALTFMQDNMEWASKVFAKADDREGFDLTQLLADFRAGKVTT